ncbi:hypothetical protein [Actinomadura sp. WMMA1423]|uniref:hypothetical protein n=1 Tax=Actinomadura sp. WMMA1423 TaxID=2591108 RepID=UPI0011475F4D|nr:hypothetical protein [Actinomadura sp. WMMA1423]
MSPTLDDLRGTLESASAHLPENTRRASDVRRRIRRGNRVRLAAASAAAMSAVAAGAVIAMPPSDDTSGQSGPTYTLSATDPVPELPNTRWGMPRIGAKRFSTTAKARIRFTPAGDDTLIIIRCAAGFTSAQWSNGLLVAFGGGCAPEGALLGMQSLSTRTSGPLKAGKPVILEVALMKKGSLPDGADPVEVERMVAAQPPVKTTWSVAVYSGRCTGPECAE